jgi:hypothetical protein
MFGGVLGGRNESNGEEYDDDLEIAQLDAATAAGRSHTAGCGNRTALAVLSYQLFALLPCDECSLV